MKHGEFKTPGGKLVIVDFEVEDERITRMQVNGDFFLEPAEALDSINAALDGLPVTASEDEFAAAVAGSLNTDTQMIGFDPAGIATAIRRALS
jgi:lipoate-protein ligase A